MSGGSGERILAILDIFSEDHLVWTPQDMMERLGYSRPTLYRYLKILKEAGLLVSLSNGGLTMGPRVVELDYLMRKSDPLVDLGMPNLRSLASAIPVTAFLVRWYGNKLLCVASHSSVDSLSSSYPRGRPMPLARGAISKAVLANLPRHQQVPIIDMNLGQLRDTGMGEDREAILFRLRGIRRAGYAIARGEVTPGVVGTAAPVFDGARVPVAVLCATMREKDHAGFDPRYIADLVKENARLLSINLSGDQSANQKARQREAEDTSA